MSTTTPDLAAAIGAPTTIDLSELGLAVPAGTTADLTIHGDRSGFVLEVTRRADTWTIQGAGSDAEVTAVRGDRTIADVGRVPPWLERVCAELGVTEVELGR